MNQPVTGELTEQLRMRPSRERERERDHVILCSTFEFLFELQNGFTSNFVFEFQVVRTSNRLKLEDPLCMRQVTPTLPYSITTGTEDHVTKTKLRGRSPQTNYTNRATTAWRS
jgi:hypothetical protein